MEPATAPNVFGVVPVYGHVEPPTARLRARLVGVGRSVRRRVARTK